MDKLKDRMLARYLLFELLKQVEMMNGGMGIGVSTWRLARKVALAGKGRTAGTVSLTAIASVAAYRLSQGDPEMLRALEVFREIAPEAADIARKHCWKKRGAFVPMPSLTPEPILEWLTIFGSFAEVWLAAEGHSYPIGANILEKVQMPILPTLFGLLLATAHRDISGPIFLAVGAGLPLQIPAVLNSLVQDKKATYEVEGTGGKKYTMTFDLDALTKEMSEETREKLRSLYMEKPFLLAIVSTNFAAQYIERKVKDGVDGWIVENVRAPGHNSKPRRKTYITGAIGRIPVYGEDDEMDIESLLKLGKPCWLAGNWAYGNSVRKAKLLGAQGVQVGSLFALSNDSGYTDKAREIALRTIRNAGGGIIARTDGDASPTGFPFKVLEAKGTMGDPAIAEHFTRGCTMGYLRSIVEINGKIVYRCPAEPKYQYLAKGGDLKDTERCMCLCRCLTAAIRNNRDPMVITLGEDIVEQIDAFTEKTRAGMPNSPPYSAELVVRYLLPKR